MGVLFAPKTRPVFERNVFHSMNMKDKDEDVVEFVSRLKKQAQRSQFGEREGENMIRDVVIAKCPYPALQARPLEAENLNLVQVVKMWQSHLQVPEPAAKLQNMSVGVKEQISCPGGDKTRRSVQDRNKQDSTTKEKVGAIKAKWEKVEPQ